MNQQKTQCLLSILIMTTAFLILGGCTASYKVNPEFVKQFEQYTKPTSEQTFVYVIRNYTYGGSFRGMWVAVNDKVVADLSAGSHALLKLDSGINSIHGVQELVGFGYIPIDYQGGETVFLQISSMNRVFEKVDRDLGITMVMETDKADELSRPRKNTAYDNLLVNPSALGFPTMTASSNTMKPDETTAVINFIRAETLAARVPYDIWSEQGFIGSTKGGTYFQTRVNPGKHTFLALSERYSVLEAEVAAGKEYFVEFDVDMGWNQAHVQIIPMNATNDANKLAEWLSESRLMTLDETVLTSREVSPRIALGMALIKEQIASVKSGKINSRKLEINSGK